MTAPEGEKKQERGREAYSKKGNCRKVNHAMHQLGEELQRKVGEENAQSNDWEFWKSERENEKRRSLKTKAQQLKTSGKFKSYTIGAFTPLIRTRHVATMGVAPPLRI